jgi:L-seryl-tRNA(Ser) seleniumtransferase
VREGTTASTTNCRTENPGNLPCAGRSLLSMDVLPSSRRTLPAVHRLLAGAEAAALLAAHARPAVLAAIRRQLDGLRRSRRPFAPEPFFAAVREALEASQCPSLRRVINATGVVLHTNLGRAPLPASALVAVAEVGGYCSLELDLATGDRDSRHAPCAALLAELTGAEAALVVNNGAAAVLLALSALAAGGEAVVSRGELVEIGGAFRIPDVVVQGGAKLVEVGTTNRTRLSDYEAAIGPATRVLLRVHQSNYRVLGFTEAPAPALADLARRRGVLAVEDLGSGARGFGAVRPAAGADDRGRGHRRDGPRLLQRRQAPGRAAGRADRRPRRGGGAARQAPAGARAPPRQADPGRPGATLRLYRDPDRLAETVPALAMLAVPVTALEARAGRLAALLPASAAAEVIAEEVLVGGGSLPGTTLPTRAVAVRAPGTLAEELARRLRLRRPAVVGRLSAGRLLLDVRTVAEGEVEGIACAVRAALAA